MRFKVPVRFSIKMLFLLVLVTVLLAFRLQHAYRTQSFEFMTTRNVVMFTEPSIARAAEDLEFSFEVDNRFEVIVEGNKIGQVVGIIGLERYRGATFMITCKGRRSPSRPRDEPVDFEELAALLREQLVSRLHIERSMITEISLDELEYPSQELKLFF